MDVSVGSDLEIVLFLNEGYDFGFLNSDFVVRVSLDCNEIVTNAFSCDQLVKFDCELIFSSTKSNIKRMKIHKVPIRLDFCRILNNVLQKPFGYTILHLSSAQYLPKGGNLLVKEETYKVCGLGKEARGSCPQVVLGLRIQDVENEIPQVPLEKNKKADISIEKESKPAKNHPIIENAELSVVQVLNCYELDLNFIRIEWLSTMKDIHLRIHHGKGEVTWVAHEDIKETVPGTITSLSNLTAKITLFETPNELENVLNVVPPQLTICTMRNGRPSVLGKASLIISTNNEDSENSVSVKSLLTLDEIAKFTYNTSLRNKGPQTLRELANDNDALTEKFKNDLEAWKKIERERFQEEFNQRFQTEITRIESQWSEKQQKLENELSEKVNICRILSDELSKVMNEVKEKEIFLEKTKMEIEAGFQSLVAETKRETATLRENLLDRLKEKDEVISRLQDELASAKNKPENKDYGITVEQIEAMLVELKKLHEKLESANKSKQFFKQQWTRAVEELYRVKSEENGKIQDELKVRKEELHQLGLDHLGEGAGNGDVN